MPLTDVLCLANSFKHGGGCVAGIRLDTEAWVRPVTDTGDGTLPNPQCWLDNGRQAAPLDVVQMDLERPAPRRHQPENWIVGSGQWTLIGTHAVGSAMGMLERVRLRDGALFGTETDRVADSSIASQGVTSSLELIRVEGFTLHAAQSPFDGKTKVRGTFRHGGVSYDLSVTDKVVLPREAQTLGTRSSDSDWYLTVSLAEPFHGNCFKVIAAAIEVPAGTAPKRKKRRLKSQFPTV